MRLRRIEAVRYGALAGTSLGDLGSGLTVVHGPNEAGKSSFTSLVRHVLYRYPTARDSEPGYAVGGEGRLARLVFEDAGGVWAIERVEGTHGGRVTVRALEGAERPDLLEDLTRGVSELAYRTVFGFGLGEMAAIEELRGSGDSVISRLYAASAGLRVSPQEVRAAVEREAAELFKPTGRKPVINALVSEVRASRAELRRLAAEAESFMAEQDRVVDMTTRLEAARAERDAARERATELAVAVERCDERLALISQQDEALKSLRRERKQLEDEASAIVVDDVLLDAAPELDALLEEAAGHARAMQSLADLEAACIRSETRLADAQTRTGLAPEVLDALADTHECVAQVEEAREGLQRLQLQAEARAETAQRAVEAAEAAEVSLARTLEPLSITGDPAESIAERLAVVDAVEAARAGSPAVARSGVDVPALIMLASGLVALVTGVFLRQWVTVGIGAVLVVAGLTFTLRARRGASLAPAHEERDWLEVLGLDANAGTLELSRVRRALDAARSAVAAAAASRRDADDAVRDAQLATDALETRRTLWAGWLAARGLQPSLTPGSASALLGLVRDAQTAAASATEARLAFEHASAQVDAFALRFAEGARPFLEVPAELAAPDVLPLANRLKGLLGAGRAAAARRDEIGRLTAALDERITTESERAGQAGEELLGVLERFGLSEGGTHEDLRVLLATAGHTQAEAEATFEQLAQSKHQLEGRLESGAREHRMGELHLEAAGLAERLAEATDRYLVLAVASRLLAEAQERYQRERQPEVVRSASSHFATMTGGRYTGLTVPLGDGRIEVFDTRANARTSEVLSRGTAEQLYLAVRLGLIGQLGEAGAGLPVLMDDVLVNFDPGRRRGAAEAIAGLAAERQVVFFTCHPDTADLFSEVAPDSVRLDLPGPCS